MSKVVKIWFLLVALSFIVGSIAMADDKDQQRDRKNDGSCDSEVTATDGVPVLAADQERKQDRKQDRKRTVRVIPK